MGGYSIGELSAGLKLDSTQYLAALDNAAAASALMTINVGKIGDSLQMLYRELNKAGFQAKEFQSYLASLRAQGFSTAESVTLLGNSLTGLQAKVAAWHSQELALVTKKPFTDAQIEANNAIVAEQKRIMALIQRGAVEDQLDKDAKLRQAEMIARDNATAQAILQNEVALESKRTALETGASTRRIGILEAEVKEAEALYAKELATLEAISGARVGIESTAAARRTGLLTSELTEAQLMFEAEVKATEAKEAARSAIEAGASARRTEILAAELARAEGLFAEEAIAAKAAKAAESAGGAGGFSAGLGVGSSGLHPRGYLSSGPLIAGGAALFGAYEVTKQAAEFQDATAKVRAAIGDVSKDMTERMGNAALELSTRVGIAAKTIVAEFATMSKAEVSLADQFKALPVLAEFAVATNTDMEKSAKLVLTVMNTLKIPFSEIGHTTDMFVQANHMALGSVDDFAKALEGRAGAAFRASKIPLSEALALTVAFARGGVEANIAQTALTQTLLKLTGSVQKHGDVVLNVGGQQMKWHDIVYNTNGELRKMYEVFQLLDKAFVGQSPEKINQFFQAIGVAGQRDVYVKSLLGMGTALEEVTKQFESVGPERLKAFNSAMDSPIQQMKLMKETFRAAAIELGTSMLPAVITMADWMKKLADAIRDVNRVNDILRAGGAVGKSLLPDMSGGPNLAGSAASDSTNIVKAGIAVATKMWNAAKEKAEAAKKQEDAAKAASDLYKQLSTTSASKVSTELFDDPQADAKREAKRLAALDKAYRIKNQEIQNWEDGEKAKLRIALLNEGDIDEADEAAVNKRRDRLIKFNEDTLAITKAANAKRLDIEKGHTGEKTDLRLEGDTAKAEAAAQEERINLEHQASAKIRQMQEQDAKEEARIRRQQDEEARRLDTQRVNDHIRALQLELEAIREHGTAVMELARGRAAFEESMGLLTKAQRLKIDRDIEADEFKLQSDAINQEITLLDGRQNRIGQKDEAIESRKQELLNRRQKLEDQHSARLQAYNQEELQGLDALEQATVRLLVAQREIANLGNQADRLIALKNLEIQTEALSIKSRGLGGVYVDLADSFKGAMGSIGKTLAGVFLDPSNFTKNWKSALHSIETELLGTFLQSLLKLGAAELLSTLKIGAAKKVAAAGNIVLIKAEAAAQIAADAEVMAARVALAKANNASVLAASEIIAIAQIEAASAVGGAAAAASIAAIPIFGPGLAIEAGEAMQAAILGTFAPSLLTFEHGGDVAKDTLALVHGGEHVIGPDLTAALKQMVANGGVGGDGVNIDLRGSHFGTGLTEGMIRGYMQSAVGELRRGGLVTKKGRF